jgi:hypothetical protein
MQPRWKVNSLILLGIALSLSGCRSIASERSSIQRTADYSSAASSEALLAIENRQGKRILHPLEQEKISITGLGPIQVGMTIPEASTATQVEFALVPESSTPACEYYKPAQDIIKGLGLMVVDGKIIRIDIRADSPTTTLSGIGIGATQADIEQKYPNQVEATPHLYTQGKYLTLTPSESEQSLYRLVFETDAEGKVTQFRTGQFPAVTWTEGCS